MAILYLSFKKYQIKSIIFRDIVYTNIIVVEILLDY